MENNSQQRMGTAPVFFTAISTILGAVLFLRFGWATGTLGFWGVMIIILIAHMVTIPTALSISEIATNKRVEGGGEYFIISRSFGLNIGATIGIALYFSQAISVAFYVIAFTEAFSPLFDWLSQAKGIDLPRQVISIPAMGLLSLLILKKGSGMGVKALYVVVAILAVSLLLFFVGKTDYVATAELNIFSRSMRNGNLFFVVFAIVFPAFTGMTAGVGLSGDLKKPGISIPLGTTLATLTGMILYFFITYKLAISASPEDLVSDQLIMRKIALGGSIVIPLGLAASTISSALGSIMVAPRTLQALGKDDSLPIKNVNKVMSAGKGATNEPFNASLFTVGVAFAFVAIGDVDAVAEIISMFFMITYGALNLISFLNHFAANPSYRPSFKSRWWISLIGFLLSVYMMFKMNSLYALLAVVLMIILYLIVSHQHKDRQGLVSLFRGVVYQINRKLHLYLQGEAKVGENETWRPAAVCVSPDSLKRDNALNLMSWISYKYGFGTYIHLYQGYYSKKTRQEADNIKHILLERSNARNGQIYVDTLISPSYTSAIAQVIQLPAVTGKENNMVVFDFDKNVKENLHQITDNFSLVAAANCDVCVLGCTHLNNPKKKKRSIHIWIQKSDPENANLMILLGYVISSHPYWHKCKISIFDVCDPGASNEEREYLKQLLKSGRLPITSRNITIIEKDMDRNIRSLMGAYSKSADLTIIGFRSNQIKHEGEHVFWGYDSVGEILFVNSRSAKVIE
ncbi:MAG: amino acid permease [Bacteroidia bacterium]|nr:amino acid permease [Bacteroidia bacterium]